MFSKELENLIQATLEDGVLEENEKAALVKRAEREGADIAELEIYINSLLQKRARELENEKTAERKQAEKEKKEAFGRKCPNCGAQVPPMTLKCECGYEFTKKESVSSAQVLFEKISKLSTEIKDEDKRNEKIRETINLFPVPNTKEDIIEFLSLAVPNSKRKRALSAVQMIIITIVITAVGYIIGYYLSGGHGQNSREVGGLCSFFFFFFGGFGLLIGTDGPRKYNKTADVWKAKYDQVMMKARTLRGDTEFTQQLDYFENMLKK